MSRSAAHPIEIDSRELFDQHIENGLPLSNVVVQAVDLSTARDALRRADLHGAVFLGCEFHPDDMCLVIDCGALIFPDVPDRPYRTYRTALYSPHELIGEYVADAPAGYASTLDGRIYAHFLATGGAKPPSMLETLTRRLHDHGITDALYEHLHRRRVVAMMGGHALSRTDARYRDVALIAQRLTEAGFTMISGGGPGAMEATHLGANLAGEPETTLDRAIDELSSAPTYDPIAPWLNAALRVAEFAPPRGEHVGIPTWLYGHEPPTPFAPHIAKYFGNSKREEGLVTLADRGIVFAPGSAGTVQEIFQDATQNHYETEGWPSPMVFLDPDYWTDTLPVLPLLRALSAGRRYEGLIHEAHGVEGAVAAVVAFQPPDR